MNWQMTRYTCQGLESPCKAGVHHPPIGTNQRASEPYSSGISMEASSHRHEQLLTQFLAHLPFLKDGV